MIQNQLRDSRPCIEIEEKIDRYAENTRNWQISRSNYVKQFGNKFDFSERHDYPYDDRAEALLFRDVNGYLYGLDENERELANGRLLWHYKSYFGHPFEKHSVNLVANSVMIHPLSDATKIQFLEYLFKVDKQDLFDDKILYKLSNYNPNANMEATNRLYNKALLYFDGAARKNDKKIATIFGMFREFSRNVKSISPEAVVSYAQIYFKLADRTDRALDAAILKDFAIKTPDAL